MASPEYGRRPDCKELVHANDTACKNCGAPLSPELVKVELQSDGSYTCMKRILCLRFVLPTAVAVAAVFLIAHCIQHETWLSEHFFRFIRESCR
ncbi:MAG: hypothetical protein KA419_15065 [Acidobacteria bacterium]|nr:hypothetical protein [Acidobacteriota bacterium]